MKCIILYIAKSSESLLFTVFLISCHISINGMKITIHDLQCSHQTIFLNDEGSVESMFQYVRVHLRANSQSTVHSLFKTSNVSR